MTGQGNKLLIFSTGFLSALSESTDEQVDETVRLLRARFNSNRGSLPDPNHTDHTAALLTLLAVEIDHRNFLKRIDAIG